MFAEVNNLPADDPLRASAAAMRRRRLRPVADERGFRIEASTDKHAGCDECAAGEGGGRVPVCIARMSRWRRRRR